MARSKEEVEDLLLDIKKWWREEFGYDYQYTDIMAALLEVKHERVKFFLFKRLSHLSNADFFLFEKCAGADFAREFTSKAMNSAVAEKNSESYNKVSNDGQTITTPAREPTPKKEKRVGRKGRYYNEVNDGGSKS